MNNKTTEQLNMSTDDRFTFRWDEADDIAQTKTTARLNQELETAWEVLQSKGYARRDGSDVLVDCVRCNGSGSFGDLGECFRCRGGKTDAYDIVELAAKIVRREKNEAKRLHNFELIQTLDINALFGAYFSTEAELLNETAFLKTVSEVAKKNNITRKAMLRDFVKETKRSEALAHRRKIDAAKQEARALKAAARKAKRAATSKHIGVVGERMTAQLTLKKCFVFEGHFGLTRLHLFEDTAENVVVWKTGTNPQLEEGTTYFLRSKVKAHAHREGVAQTLVTHVKEAA